MSRAWLCVLAGGALCVVVAGIILVLVFADPEPKPSEVVSRLPIAGSNYTIVLKPDGQSSVEDQKGNKLPEPATLNELKRSGQLVVCDLGVVLVPTDAVITFIGRDKVVTHAADGTSMTYYTDGRVERHDRGGHNQKK